MSPVPQSKQSSHPSRTPASGSRNAGPARTLGLVGSPNFRDAGGYASQAGGRLHWGRVYRSGHLAGLTEDDESSLRDVGLQLVIDLRRADERDREPSKLPDGVRLVGAEITPGSQASAIYSDSTQLGGSRAMYEFMCEINREFVSSQSHAFRDVFAELLASNAERVLFHCSAGKDRTGFAVAMLHLALDVGMADIEADYLLSRHYYLPEDQVERVRAKYAVAHLSDADLLPMLRTDFAYLAAALDAIDRDWPSRETYLEAGLGLGEAERRELRRRFVST
jgi:protein-tyrosine phosphatase